MSSNTNVKKYRIHAFLRTLSPMHIASPESARIDIAEMKPVYVDSKEYPPLTLTQKINVLEAGGGSRPVPVIAANNIMGRLRRHAAKAVGDVLKAKGQKISITTYMALQCGAATGNPDGRDVLFSEYEESRANVYLGLFGGGPRMVRRNVRLFNAVPFNDTTVGMFGRTQHPFMDEAIHKAPSDSRKLVQSWIMNRNDDLRELVNVDLAAATVRDFSKEIAERQAAILASSAKDARGEGDPRHSTRSFTALEFVVPGVYFPICFELEVTDAQLGLFLVALDSFAKTERIGGHGRNGFGAFSLTDVCATDFDGNMLATDLFNKSALNAENAFVQPLLNAWAEAAQGIEGAVLDRLFALPEDKPAAKNSKAKAKAEEVA